MQTNYAIAFTLQPPASATGGVALSPAPTVTVTESVSQAPGTSLVTITDTDSALSASGTNSAALSAGTATFNNLIFSKVESNDTLTASLILNPNLNPALTLTTAPSTGVNVVGETAALLSQRRRQLCRPTACKSTQGSTQRSTESGSTTTTSTPSSRSVCRRPLATMRVPPVPRLWGPGMHASPTLNSGVWGRRPGGTAR